MGKTLDLTVVEIKLKIIKKKRLLSPYSENTSDKSVQIRNPDSTTWKLILDNPTTEKIIFC